MPNTWAELAQLEADRLDEDTFLDDLGRNAKGLGEAALTMGTSIAADIPAGWAGLMAGSHGQDPVPAIEKVQNAFTYQPRTQEGQNYLQGLGDAVNKIMDPVVRGIDATQQAADRAGLPPWVTALPLAIGTGLMESVPGPQKGASKAGRFVRMADEAADMEFLRIAESHDPNITLAAQDMQAGQPLRPADPDLVDNMPNSNVLTDADIEAMANTPVGGHKAANDYLGPAQSAVRKKPVNAFSNDDG